jgi:hypothetical protein
MAAYATLLFNAATRVDLGIALPSLPFVVAKTNSRGGRLNAALTLTGDVRNVDSPVSSFERSISAETTTLTRLDSSVVESAFERLTPDYDDIDWRLSGKYITVTISDDEVSLIGDEISPLYKQFPMSRLGDTFISYPQNILLPSIDTLIYRLRENTVDAEILKATFSSIAFGSDAVGPLYIKDKIGKVAQSARAQVLMNVYRSERGFEDILVNLNDRELSLVIQSLLYAHLSSLTFTGFSSQLSSHHSLMLHLDFNEPSVAYSAGSESFRLDLAWFDYAGVLFPASLLVTPSFGVRGIMTATSVGIRYAEDLLMWARSMPVDSGFQIISDIISKYARAEIEKGKPRRASKSKESQ